jgi:TnsA endonuclease N terminal/TnsA endonuclease C terminal
MPVRKIPHSRRSLTGRVARRTRDASPMFESSLERDLFILLDFDIGIASFEEQPLRISFTDAKGCLHNYTPDVLIHYHPDPITAYQMPPLLAEVKYRQDLFKNWKELKPKFKAARAFSREKGWQPFCIFTEHEIRTPYLETVKFLRGFTHLEPAPNEVHLLLNNLAALRITTPQSLLLACSTDPMRGAELIPTLWHLVALRHIGCNLDERLTMLSSIWSLDSPMGS